MSCYIAFNSEKIEGTAAATEQGSWNLLFSLLPHLANKSKRNLNKQGYALKKDRKERKKDD